MSENVLLNGLPRAGKSAFALKFSRSNNLYWIAVSQELRCAVRSQANLGLFLKFYFKIFGWRRKYELENGLYWPEWLVEAIVYKAVIRCNRPVIIDGLRGEKSLLALARKVEFKLAISINIDDEVSLSRMQNEIFKINKSEEAMLRRLKQSKYLYQKCLEEIDQLVIPSFEFNNSSGLVDDNYEKIITTLQAYDYMFK